MNFYSCDKCDAIVALISGKEEAISCCGETMKKMEAGVKDAAKEKHVPVVTVEGNTVKVCVGEVNHPMTEEHLIQWVALVTEQGIQIKYIRAGDAPAAEFVLAGGDKVKEVYAYCNLHGLWKA